MKSREFGQLEPQNPQRIKHLQNKASNIKRCVLAKPIASRAVFRGGGDVRLGGGHENGQNGWFPGSCVPHLRPKKISFVISKEIFSLTR